MILYTLNLELHHFRRKNGDYAQETSDVEGEKNRKKARNSVSDEAVAATGRVGDIERDIEDGTI